MKGDERMKKANGERPNRERVPRSAAARRVRRARPRGGAFTLIELLVVIAVIAILAALTFPAVRGVRISMTRARAKGEMAQIETAIERYKDKLGHYPPDARLAGNPNPYALNTLYYELLGTTNAGGVFRTLDDSAQIEEARIPLVFGPEVRGFVNCAHSGGDEAVVARSFLRGLNGKQYLAITNGASADPVCTVLGSTLEGPLVYQDARGAKLNPWRYNSSNPTNNPNSFDLWMDIAVGGKTNRICNWSDKPLVVSAP